jgi:hypothetical protein
VRARVLLSIRLSYDQLLKLPVHRKGGGEGWRDISVPLLPALVCWKICVVLCFACKPQANFLPGSG